MAEIQFTYDNIDKEIAISLAGSLRDNGHNVFLRNEDIQMGKLIFDQVISGFKSADFLVVILSEHSIKNKWVKHEVSTAIGYNIERKKPIIIPIVFDDVALPFEFNGLGMIVGTRGHIKETQSLLSFTISKLIGESQAIEEENKENAAKVEENAEIYIREAITRLTAKEKDYRRIAYSSYVFCGVFLVFAIVFLLYKVNLIINSQKVLTTSEQIQLGLVGFVLLALIISVARFLYLIGKSFMVESLRNSDRIHAISFGEFYLKAYGGAKADWNEIKDAFQHWNIDGGSSFNSQSANDFDPEIFKNIIEFTKVITSKK
ncbi:TIR domain-containing protein [Bacillus thuringiensis]|uniref:TIR domain-containing protein n=1 Tax=Bacillus thuringiensis TaxID=1428 RepID=UPI0038067556